MALTLCQVLSQGLYKYCPFNLDFKSMNYILHLDKRELRHGQLSNLLTLRSHTPSNRFNANTLICKMRRSPWIISKLLSLLAFYEL